MLSDAREPNCCNRPTIQMERGDDIASINSLIPYVNYRFENNWWDDFSHCALWDCGHIDWGHNISVNQEEQRYIRRGDLPDQYFPFRWQPPVGEDLDYEPAHGEIVARKVPDELSRSNIVVQNGKLIKQPYVSGILTTRYDSLFHSNYLSPWMGIPMGRISISAQLSKNAKDFGALWAIKSQQPGQWESEYIPEIDIMEYHGHNPEAIHTGAHFYENQLFSNQSRDHSLHTDLSAGFHTYGIDWTPECIGWHLDGKYIFVIQTPADFQSLSTRLTLVMNLAVGGSWNDWQRKHDESYGIFSDRDDPESELKIESIRLSRWRHL